MLKNCAACNATMSKSAIACPICGHPNKTISAQRITSLNESIGLGVLCILVAVCVATWVSQCTSERDNLTVEGLEKQAAQEVVKKAKKSADKQAVEDAEAKCLADKQCWGHKALWTGNIMCAPLIETKADHQFNWLDTGWLERKFSLFMWINKDVGTMRVFGDKLQFQNEFGAMTRMSYACDVDPKENTVLSVNVWKGNLTNTAIPLDLDAPEVKLPVPKEKIDAASLAPPMPRTPAAAINTSQVAQRPGWCDKAATNAEKIICADDDLSDIDSRMFTIYKAAEIRARGSKGFYAESRAWRVLQRDTCTTKNCLIDAYQLRMNELMALPLPASIPAPLAALEVQPVQQLGHIVVPEPGVVMQESRAPRDGSF